jgi:hypothetical protein
MVKSLLIRCLSAGLSTHQVVTVRLPTDRLIDGVALTSTRESRPTPHGDVARRVRATRASSERELGMARAGLKALLLPKWRIEFDQHRSAQPRTPEISEAKKANAAYRYFPDLPRGEVEAPASGGSHNSGKSWKTMDFYGLVTIDAEICYHHSAAFNPFST